MPPEDIHSADHDPDAYVRLVLEHEQQLFISVGAVCQRLSTGCFLRVVSFMLSLVCLAKRKRALRGRNLPRDSQAKGAPRACQASGVQGTPAAFFVPFGHPCHASKNPIRDGWVKTVAFVRFSWSRFVVVALGILGGIISPIQRRRSGATRRVDSSLRSHRTRRSECRHVYSGLNKTLFASVGPNLRCRGHRLRCPAKPGRLPQAERQRCQSGRIKPGRGHRHDGMPRVRSLAPVRDIAGIPPHVVDGSKGSSSLLSGLAGAVWPHGPCWRQKCGRVADRVDKVCCRGPWHTGAARGGGPWRRWP